MADAEEIVRLLRAHEEGDVRTVQRSFLRARTWLRAELQGAPTGG